VKELRVDSIAPRMCEENLPNVRRRNTSIKITQTETSFNCNANQLLVSLCKLLFGINLVYFRNVTINRLFSGLFFRFRLGISVKINLVGFFSLVWCRLLRLFLYAYPANRCDWRPYVFILSVRACVRNRRLICGSIFDRLAVDFLL